MARSNDLQSLVQQFVSQLEGVLAKQLESDLASKFDAFRASVLRGGAVAPSAPRSTTVVAAKGTRKRSPLAGREAELKPCPVCGKMTKARRFSYLCEEHRTPENQAKFKGAAKTGAAPAAKPAAAAAKKAPAKAAKAAKTAKRGPGRPKGSKNKKSGAKGEAPAASA
jgi:hypothetical protein